MGATRKINRLPVGITMENGSSVTTIVKSSWIELAIREVEDKFEVIVGSITTEIVDSDIIALDRLGYWSRKLKAEDECRRQERLVKWRNKWESERTFVDEPPYCADRFVRNWYDKDGKLVLTELKLVNPTP